MQKPDMEAIARLLDQASNRTSGHLPELYRIAWHSYLSALLGEVIDDIDAEKVWQHFPNFDTDPDAHDPVLAIALGKHYKPDPNIPKGDCVLQTRLEELTEDIEDDLIYFTGQLPPGYAVAWSARLLGLHDCKDITDSEYERLKAMLPLLESNPVKEVEAFTRRYCE